MQTSDNNTKIMQKRNPKSRDGSLSISKFRSYSQLLVFSVSAIGWTHFFWRQTQSDIFTTFEKLPKVILFTKICILADHSSCSLLSTTMGWWIETLRKIAQWYQTCAQCYIIMEFARLQTILLQVSSWDRYWCTYGILYVFNLTENYTFTEEICKIYWYKIWGALEVLETVHRKLLEISFLEEFPIYGGKSIWKIECNVRQLNGPITAEKAMAYDWS
jgi:hypothetical protein